jgi:hypothetical protein
MKTTAIAVSLPQVRSWPCLPERLADFVSLMKPHVMLLAVFTAVVGLAISPRHLDLLHDSFAILAIATGAGVAGVRCCRRWAVGRRDISIRPVQHFAYQVFKSALAAKVDSDNFRCYKVAIVNIDAARYQRKCRNRLR